MDETIQAKAMNNPFAQEARRNVELREQACLVRAGKMRAKGIDPLAVVGGGAGAAVAIGACVMLGPLGFLAGVAGASLLAAAYPDEVSKL